jgi:hypothetical protein
MRTYWSVLASAPLLTALLLLPAEVRLTNNDRRELEKIIPKTVYLRIDLPCVYGKQMGALSFIAWVEPLVEVSPTGFATEQDPGWRGSVWTGTRRKTFWAFGPNDALKYGSLEIGKDDTIKLYFEGLGPKQLKKNQEAAVKEKTGASMSGTVAKQLQKAAVKLVKVKTAADFKAAFDRAFSPVPLQDEHPEWPEEIRKAVGEHRVIEGMTKDQVSCVVGKPTDIETGEENGNKVETWHIRQGKGVWSGWGMTDRKQATGFASKLKFVDDKLAVISSEPEAKKK